MTWQELCQLAARFAGVTIDTWYGTPALKVRGKGIVRLREDAATVVFVLDSIDAQDALIEARPELYFLTEHYRGHAAVLARLAELSRDDAMERIEHAWRHHGGAATIRGGKSRQAAAASPARPRSRSARTRAGVRSRG